MNKFKNSTMCFEYFRGLMYWMDDYCNVRNGSLYSKWDIDLKINFKGLVVERISIKKGGQNG